MGFTCLRDIAQAARIPFDPDPRPDDPIVLAEARVPPEDRDRLVAVGFATPGRRTRHGPTSGVGGSTTSPPPTPWLPSTTHRRPSGPDSAAVPGGVTRAEPAAGPPADRGPAAPGHPHEPERGGGPPALTPGGTFPAGDPAPWAPAQVFQCSTTACSRSHPRTLIDAGPSTR